MSAKGTVYGRTNVWASMPDGPPVFIQLGSVWRSDDEVVRRWPDLFADESPISHSSQPLTRGQGR